MATAAYCAGCQTNVWITPDGRCPNGHGPESLSGRYEVDAAPAAPDTVGSPDGELVGSSVPGPPASMADAAIADAPAARRATTNTLTIVLVVVAVVVLCGLGSCVATCAWAGSTIDDAATTTTDQTDTTDGETVVAPQSGDTSDISAATVEELDRVVRHFYPAFSVSDYYVVGTEEADGSATYHIIAAYDGNADFRLTFFIDRVSGESPAGSENAAQAYLDQESGLWWLHPQTRDHALDVVFGPGALMVDSMMQQIADDFVAAHPTKIVSDVTDMTNVDLGLAGIDETRLEDWYDDGQTFTSTLKLDLNNSTWNEVGYSEN